MIVMFSIDELWCFLTLEICIGQWMRLVKLKIVLTSLPTPLLGHVPNLYFVGFFFFFFFFFFFYNK